MNHTYKEYQEQIAELQRKAAEVRSVEVEAAKTQIRALMTTYDLNLGDLAGMSAKAKAKDGKVRAKVEMKYRDPVSGQEWTGRGRAPKWMEGKNKEEFLIKKEQPTAV